MPRPTDAQLAAHLRDLLPSGSLDEAIGMADAGPEAAGRMADPLSRRVVGKLDRDRPLDPAERFHLEAIILPDLRPVLDILDGSYRSGHHLWTDLNDPEVRSRIEARIPGVGRIDLPSDPRLPYAGTGFVVGPGLLMTNRHVAQLFTAGAGQQGLRFLPGTEAGVDFRRERGAPDAPLLKLRAPVMMHPYWDMALMSVEGLPEGIVPLALSPEPAEALTGRRVAVIGFPAFDPRNAADVQMRVFGGVFGVKRLQPGKITGLATTASIGGMVRAMLHDASTLGGNSGSCMVDLATGAVLGLHFGGRYLVTNHAVPAAALARDARVLAAGVAIAGPVPEPGGAWDAAWAAIEGTGTPAMPPSATGSGAVSAGAAGGGLAGGGSGGASVTLTADGAAQIRLPLEITVRIGTGAGAPAAMVAAVAAADTAADGIERMVEPYRHRDYTDRPGYDPEFLGTPVPMPLPRDPALVLVLPDGGHELRYYNFSVVMHARRRLALVTAANVDYRPEATRPEPRPASDYSRRGLGGLGSNDQERWFPDPRLPAEAQLPDRFYTRDRGAFDKGHIVRRNDVAWGPSWEAIRRANGDTFHVTNCSPQTAGFNRAPLSEDNWGDLEVEVQKNAATMRLSVLGGPVLAEDDPLFAGVDDDGRVAVPIPVRFWKVIAANGAAGLQVFGFVLEQDLSAVQWEFLLTDRWRRFLVPLARIEAMTGLDFARPLREADQFGAEAGRRLCAAAGIDRAGPEPDSATGGDAPPVPPKPDVIDFWARMQAGEGGPDAETATARFVLTLAEPVSDAALQAELTRATGLELTVGPLFAPDRATDRFRLVEVPGVAVEERDDLFDFARFLRDVSGATMAEPDLGTDYFDDDRAEAPPEGTAESAKWSLGCWVGDDKAPDEADWAIDKVRLRQAWKASADAGRPAMGKGIVIFQPDTGIAPHREIPAGWVSDPRAVNLVESGPAVDPLTGGSNGHGTATGSVAASPGSNRVTGAAPAATLVPIRAIRAVTVFDQSRVAQAIDHARRNGAHVITMSLGGAFSSALHAAVRQAVAQNVIVMAAAGNCVRQVVWPARYDDCIAVAGVNVHDLPWKGSCRGAAVDISGPAEFVLRALARKGVSPDKVAGGQGTSYAVAQLSGIAACWLAHHGRDALIARLPPGMKLQHLFRRALRASARKPAGFDTTRYGAGIVNAEALLAQSVEAILAAEMPEAPPRDDAALVGELIADVLGPGGFEAAAAVADDPQNLLELACFALDRARFAQTALAAAEAPPMPGFSAGLAQLLGAEAIGRLRGAAP